MVCKINKDGSRFWCNENGKRHRLNGPAVIDDDGSTYWYLYGKIHREDGPAIEWVIGTKEWYQNGKRHREDGPAIEWANGYKEYWIDGKLYTKKEWSKRRGM